MEDAVKTISAEFNIASQRVQVLAELDGTLSIEVKINGQRVERHVLPGDKKTAAEFKAHLQNPEALKKWLEDYALSCLVRTAARYVSLADVPDDRPHREDMNDYKVAFTFQAIIPACSPEEAHAEAIRRVQDDIDLNHIGLAETVSEYFMVEVDPRPFDKDKQPGRQRRVDVPAAG